MATPVPWSSGLARSFSESVVAWTTLLINRSGAASAVASQGNCASSRSFQKVVSVESGRFDPDPARSRGGQPSGCSTDTEVQTGPPGPRARTSSRWVVADTNRFSNRFWKLGLNRSLGVCSRSRFRKPGERLRDGFPFIPSENTDQLPWLPLGDDVEADKPEPKGGRAWRVCNKEEIFVTLDVRGFDSHDLVQEPQTSNLKLYQ